MLPFCVCSNWTGTDYRGFVVRLNKEIGKFYAALSTYYLHGDGTLHRRAIGGGWFNDVPDAIKAIDLFYTVTLKD